VRLGRTEAAREGDTLPARALGCAASIPGHGRTRPSSANAASSRADVDVRSQAKPAQRGLNVNI
jgi:hypothetical protein